MSKNLVTYLIALVVTHGVSRVVFADKLDDFKEASTKTGCQAIPYNSERGECDDQQRRKDAVCNELSCSRSQVEKLLEKLKEKRQSLVDAKARNNESVIPDLERTILEIEADLKERKAQAEKRITRRNDCITARERVQRVFANVTSQVKGESDLALQPYVRILVEHFEKGALEHVRPLEEAKGALTNCEWVYREINL